MKGRQYRELALLRSYYINFLFKRQANQKIENHWPHIRDNILSAAEFYR